MLLADRIILLVYKQGFINSIPALQILIWAEVFVFINYLMGFLLNSINKAKLFTFSTGICVLISIMLNFILISLYSYKGAAFATVATEVINFGLLFYFTAKNGYRLPLAVLVYKPVIAGLVMGVFIIYMSGLHILLLVSIAAAIYFAALSFMKGIEKEEIELVKGIFRLS